MPKVRQVKPAKTPAKTYWRNLYVSAAGTPYFGYGTWKSEAKARQKVANASDSAKRKWVAVLEFEN